MCGFFGITKKNYLKDYSFDDVRQRGNQHYTFDHKDYYNAYSVLRLSGSGECTYENDQHIVTFTGELYNFDDSLFSSDVEYLIYHINNSNYSIFNYINGMYGISVYDKKEETVTLIRDPIGQIPLFYYNKNVLVFSNTIKSIVKNVNTHVSHQQFKQYLNTKHFIFDQSPWKHIRLFQKGSIAKFDKNGKIIQFQQIIPKHYNINIGKVFQHIKDKYKTAHPSYSIISGGIDSSIISKTFDDSVCGFVGIDNQGKDYISNNLNQYQQYLKNSIDIIKVTEKEWCEYVDEFINETYIIPYSWSWIGYYIISKHLNNKVRVAYTGEGADEVFGGYQYKGLSTRGLIVDNGIISKKSKKVIKKFKSPNLSDINKHIDKLNFVSYGCIGSNISFGTSCIESRNPFLDHQFFYNDNFLYDVEKTKLVNMFEKMFHRSLIKKKQGFAGFPNEYYNHVFGTDLKNFDNNDKWKIAKYYKLKCIDQVIK